MYKYYTLYIPYVLSVSISYNSGGLYIFSLLSQTSFSLYLYNQWTNFHKLSYSGKPQIRAICTYVGCTKVTTNDWDIRPSVAIKASSANISWMAEQICTIKLALESAHQIRLQWYMMHLKAISIGRDISISM